MDFFGQSKNYTSNLFFLRKFLFFLYFLYHSGNRQTKFRILMKKKYFFDFKSSKNLLQSWADFGYFPYRMNPPSSRREVGWVNYFKIFSRFLSNKSPKFFGYHLIKNDRKFWKVDSHHFPLDEGGFIRYGKWTKSVREAAFSRLENSHTPKKFFLIDFDRSKKFF